MAILSGNLYFSYSKEGWLAVHENSENDPSLFFQSSGIFRIRNLSSFVVLTRNAKLSKDDRLMEILVELENESWDIVLFTETRRPSEYLQLDQDHILLCSGDTKLPTGVALLIHAPS